MRFTFRFKEDLLVYLLILISSTVAFATFGSDDYLVLTILFSMIALVAISHLYKRLKFRWCYKCKVVCREKLVDVETKWGLGREINYQCPSCNKIYKTGMTHTYDG